MHCSKGMVCVKSKAMPEYNICKPDWSDYKQQAKNMGGLFGAIKRWHETGKWNSVFDSADQAAAQHLLGFTP